MPTPRFSITITGPDPDFRIAKAADSAAAAWSRHLVSDAVIDWHVTSTSLPAGQLGWGGSVYTASIGPNLWEPQAAHELRTGIDTTPDGADAFAKVDPSQILSDADLEDVLLHELGHALGFDLFGSGVNKTPFEALVIDGHFTGPAAQALYGGPVPVSGPHLAVTGDLMFPGEDEGGHHITPLTLAVLNDLGLETVEAFGTIGPDTLTAKPTGGTIFAGHSDDSVAGRAGADTLHGGPGNDSIRGGKGDDLLDGGTGGDTLRGDLGNDTLSGGSGADLFCFGDNDGTDVITDFSFDIGNLAGSDHLQFASAPTVSVDYETYSVRYEAGSTVVILQNCISIMPDLVMVA